MLRTLVAITDNEPGVLDRVASTFRRRRFRLAGRWSACLAFGSGA